MISFIAISAEISLFQNERILDSEWAKRFPGAQWIPLLSERLSLHSISVTTADVALSHVRQGYWAPHCIGVIQHLDDHFTEDLIKMGAQPLIITSFESPLYVPAFYESVNEIAAKFRFRLLFSGLLDQLDSAEGTNIEMTFPSFNKEDLQAIVDWNKRKFMVSVVSNKYDLDTSLAPRGIFEYMRFLWRMVKWSALQNRGFFSKLSFSKIQLQDERLSAIMFFAARKRLKLYGKGWSSIANIPRYYRSELEFAIAESGGIECSDKINTMKNFKFALCFENCSYPGYVTEKIVDCFVAGVIPVYLGAPNVEHYIPEGAFIDVRNFRSREALLEKLDSITKQEATEIIERGREFLRSAQGQRFSYRGFASSIESLVVGELNK